MGKNTIKKRKKERKKDGNNDPVCKTAKETDVKKRLLDSVGEGEGGMI